MSAERITAAFMPLVDAAPLIVAREMGFAGEEGIELDLVRAPSWSLVRDMLAFGHVEAAQMLSAVPVAMALGLGGVPAIRSAPLSVPMVLSMNGNVIGVSRALEARLRKVGHDFGFNDPEQAGKALASIAGTKPLRIGVPFPFSMHAELLYYWLTASGLPAPQNIDIRTVPPPLMAEALAADDIDAFCVGEPWGSMAVEAGNGALLIPGSAIWSAAPEKVLAVRDDWAEDQSALLNRLMRAIWRACRWLGESGSHTTAAELLARPEYLNLSPEILDRSLTGRMVVSPEGESRDCPDLVDFHSGAANFPWKSQAAWIADRMATRLGLDRDEAIAAAKRVFRTDFYRTNLRDVGAPLPGASEKVEGGNSGETSAATESGRLVLARNRFFDGRVFDPSK